MAKMLLFLAVLAALARLLPAVYARAIPRGERTLRLVEVLHLGGDRQLYLVKAGDRTLLLGGARQSLSFLCELPPGGEGKAVAPEPVSHEVEERGGEEPRCG